MISPLLPPGIRPASMNSTSPPTGVHASPTATPGRRVRSATSVSVRNRGAPRSCSTISGVISTFSRRSFGDAARLLAADRADLPLQVAHAGLARVAPHDKAHRVVGEIRCRRLRSSPFSTVCRGIR